VSVLLDILLGAFWLGLYLFLQYLVAPPRLELAVRLGPRGRTTAKSRVRGNVLRIAIQSQQYQDVDGPLVLRVDLDAPGRLQPLELWGFLGTPEDRRHVHIAATRGSRDHLRGIDIRIDRLRALKTLVFELGCSPVTTRACGSLAGLRAFSQVLAGELSSGPKVAFNFAWGVERIDMLPAQPRDAGPMRPWGQRFPRRRPHEVGVALIGGALATISFLLFSRLLGASDFWADGAWITTVLVWSCLIGATTLVFALVRPRAKPIAQGFFEPTALTVVRHAESTTQE
jgi:hypothetical protein